MADRPNTSSNPPKDGGFATTHWSVVMTAGKGDSAQAADALGQLCRTYWYPLYAFVRRQGHGAQDAEDLTQEFFARFLEKEYIRVADRARGRFRTFLLHALDHFLVNEWKRGGRLTHLSLDLEGAEQRYANESANTLSPAVPTTRPWCF